MVIGRALIGAGFGANNQGLGLAAKQHIARVIADDGIIEPSDLGIKKSFQFLAQSISETECALQTHYQRVLADSGTGVDFQRMRVIYNNLINCN